MYDTASAAQGCPYNETYCTLDGGSSWCTSCPTTDGWYSDKPSDTYFSYDTRTYGSSTCYKVSDCKSGYASCDKDHYTTTNYHDQKICYTSCNDHAGTCAADLTEEDCTNAGYTAIHYDRVCAINGCGHIIEEDGCILCASCTEWSD